MFSSSLNFRPPVPAAFRPNEWHGAGSLFPSQAGPADEALTKEITEFSVQIASN